jgi:O-antigen ligase
VLLALLAVAAATAPGAGILLSLSRGAWIGVLAALGTMLATWGPTSRRWLAPGAGLLVLLVLLTATNIVPGGWSDRLVAIAENFGVFDVRTVEVTGENFAVVERMAHWQAAWYMLLDHPLVGVGVGNYPDAYDDYALPGWREALGHAHNYYLNMAAEAGLFGLAALLLLLVAIFRTLARGLRVQRPGSFAHALVVGLLGSFIVLCVHNLFDNLLVHGMPVQVGLLMGLTAVGSEPAVAGNLTIGGSDCLAELE